MKLKPILARREKKDPLLARPAKALWRAFFPFFLACSFTITLSPISAEANWRFFLASAFSVSPGRASDTSPASASTVAPLLEAVLNSDLNPLQGEVLSLVVGESAFLSDAGPAGSLADVTSSAPTSDQISVYVVRPGDTLSGIAKMFDVSINTVMWSNDLKKGQALKVGQTLVILPISGVRYVVKKGDTIVSIAKVFHGDADEILNFNNLASAADLKSGDTIIIPNGEISPVVATPRPGTKPGTIATIPGGYYAWPVRGGRRTQGLHGHNGIDIGAPVGTPILAAASGTVIIARSGGWNGGYGSYVVIRHQNGTQTLYAHASTINVSAGQVVERGQVIAKIGTSGLSTGAHLHFEVRGARNPF